MAQLLIIMDFDNSLIPCDSDLYVPEQLAPHLLPIFTDLYHQQHIPWNETVRRMLLAMHDDANIKRQQIIDALKQIKIEPNLVHKLNYLQQRGALIAILSDANTVYIDTILRQNQVNISSELIFTNPAEFDGDLLKLRAYHSDAHASHKCSYCPSNLCKGTILSDLQLRWPERRIIYVGDGSNDFCPSIRLHGCDAIFVRQDFVLDKLIKENESIINANIVRWKTFNELAVLFHALE